VIDRISGILLGKPPANAIIDVGGIAFSIAVPMSTWERLPALGVKATLFTHLHVREDAMLLFGFDSSLDRQTFILLIGVNGVGPKLALAILSRFDRDELSEVIAAGDLRRIQAVPGVGKKMAERLMVELKGRLGTPSGKGFGTGSTAVGATSASEAVAALESLGFTLQQADEAVRKARGALGDTAPVEELIKKALKGG